MTKDTSTSIDSSIPESWARIRNHFRICEHAVAADDDALDVLGGIVPIPMTFTQGTPTEDKPAPKRVVILGGPDALAAKLDAALLTEAVKHQGTPADIDAWADNLAAASVASAEAEYDIPSSQEGQTERWACGAVNPTTGMVCVTSPHSPEVGHIAGGETWYAPVRATVDAQAAFEPMPDYSECVPDRIETFRVGADVPDQRMECEPCRDLWDETLTTITDAAVAIQDKYGFTDEIGGRGISVLAALDVIDINIERALKAVHPLQHSDVDALKARIVAELSRCGVVLHETIDVAEGIIADELRQYLTDKESR